MQGGENPSKNTFFIPFKPNSPDYILTNILGRTDNKRCKIAFKMRDWAEVPEAINPMTGVTAQ